LIDRIERLFVLVPLCFQGKVDHHDRVLLHYADEQNDSAQGDDAELTVSDQQGENRPDTGRG